MKLRNNLIPVFVTAVTLSVAQVAGADTIGYFSGVVTSYTSDDGYGQPILIDGPKAGDVFTGSFRIFTCCGGGQFVGDWSVTSGNEGFSTYYPGEAHLTDDEIAVGAIDVFNSYFQGYVLGPSGGGLFLDLKNQTGHFGFGIMGTIPPEPWAYKSFSGNVNSITTLPDVGSASMLLAVGLAGLALLRQSHWS